MSDGPDESGHTRRPEEPLHLLCPITHVMFRDPVIIVSCGQTYERWAILEHWRRRGRPHDPLSNLYFDEARLETDLEKRREVEEYLQQHGDCIPVGWEGRQLPAPQENHTWNACAALEQLALNKAEARVVIREEGAIPALVTALREHPKDAALQMSSCAALECLAIDNPENRFAIAEEGGVELIVAALRNHPRTVELQAHAASALANLAFESAGNGLAVADAGGISVLVAALRRHRNNSWVQGHACAALTRVVAAGNYISRHTREIVEAEGITHIAQALRSHLNDTWLKGHACGALSAIATAGSGVRQDIVAKLDEFDLDGSCPNV